jgi:hypothetical protein
MLPPDMAWKGLTMAQDCLPSVREKRRREDAFGAFQETEPPRAKRGRKSVRIRNEAALGIAKFVSFVKHNHVPCHRTNFRPHLAGTIHRRDNDAIGEEGIGVL